MGSFGGPEPLHPEARRPMAGWTVPAAAACQAGRSLGCRAVCAQGPQRAGHWRKAHSTAHDLSARSAWRWAGPAPPERVHASPAHASAWLAAQRAPQAARQPAGRDAGAHGETLPGRLQQEPRLKCQVLCLESRVMHSAWGCHAQRAGEAHLHEVRLQQVLHQLDGLCGVVLRRLQRSCAACAASA